MGTKDDDKKKVGAVSSSGSTKGVKATESISEIDQIKAMSGISGISRVSGVGKAGAIGAMTFEQREKLLGIVAQEAEKLASQGLIPKSQRDVVEQAVKMVIDAALLDSGETKKK